MQIIILRGTARWLITTHFHGNCTKLSNIMSSSPCKKIVSSQTFSAIANGDIDQLSSFSDIQLRPILPCLVRMSLCAPLDSSPTWKKERKKILKCLSGIEIVNSLVGLLSIDFHALEQDARKEQQLRMKLGNNQSESVLISQLENSVALEFEKTDAARKLRLLLSELLFIMSKIDDVQSDFYIKSSELFESEVYLEEVADVLCIAQAELPGLLSVTDVAEALLHVKNGAWLLTRMVANMPDAFKLVCNHLVSNGEKQDEDSVGGRMRGSALKAMCAMCPQHALAVRNMCVDQCRLPALAVTLTLQYSHERTIPEGDIVSFVTGLLLGNDGPTRSWFSQYIRNGQKTSDSPPEVPRRKDAECSLVAMRTELLQQLQTLMPGDTSHMLHQSKVVKACAFIRLYCAMKGIAALRFNDEETRALLALITCRPPRSEAGGRFVSLGLCMLLACPYLPTGHDQERLAVEWLKWLVAEAGHFEQEVGGKSSFGQMLLLIAIHFHGNQNTAIADLVSSTLGMKSAVKANALSKIKQMFTVEIFTEQVVATHAVKVNVTKALNADITGYLPVHCIYQLLKSRAFSKHKVAIKDWIYRQICVCTTPIHPVMPSLIEVYINSIVLPSNKSDRTNEPITEREILDIFRHQVVFQHQQSKKMSGSLMSQSSFEGQPEVTSSNFTSQVLLLYYLLLYQDTVYNNMKTIVTSGRQVQEYSPQLWAKLPLKYLLQQAQKQQKQYAGLFSPLLKLLATHYPHLCLVEDWLDEELSTQDLPQAVVRVSGFTCDVQSISASFKRISDTPTELLLYIEQLACIDASELLPFADVLVSNLSSVLPPCVPRRICDLMKKLWVRLNTVMPRRLRVMTVNALCHTQQGSAFRRKQYTEEDLTLDPLIILSCDTAVFRCPPVMDVLLRVLEAFSLASKAHFVNHTYLTSLGDKPGSSETQEREQLRDALIGTQESSIVQLLLETCIETPDEKAEPGILSALREVQGIVCSYLHQKFIADPSLVKLLHFQGYPSELLAVTVAGIPSMHICLDFIPELISQPDLEKQIFAVELVSYLSIQYSLPKSLGVAKLAVNVMSTLVSVLPSDTRPDFFLPTLPALARISAAFPPLCDDVVGFLIQLGKVCSSHLANIGGIHDVSMTSCKPLPVKGSAPPSEITSTSKHSKLYYEVQRTYTEVVENTVMIKESQ